MILSLAFALHYSIIITRVKDYFLRRNHFLTLPFVLFSVRHNIASNAALFSILYFFFVSSILV